MHKLISIDFDNTLARYDNGWTGVEPTEPPMPGALDFINWLVQNGYKIAVFSLRATREGGASGIYRWLEKNNFPVKAIKITAIKQPADLFIDDKAYRFTGNFNEIKTFIKNNITE